jgi:hypothetical protein
LIAICKKRGIIKSASTLALKAVLHLVLNFARGHHKYCYNEAAPCAVYSGPVRTLSDDQAKAVAASLWKKQKN